MIRFEDDQLLHKKLTRFMVKGASQGSFFLFLFVLNLDAFGAEHVCVTNQDYFILRDKGIRQVEARSFSISASVEGGVVSSDPLISHSNPETALEWFYATEDFWFMNLSGRSIQFNAPRLTIIEGGTVTVRVIHAECRRK